MINIVCNIDDTYVDFCKLMLLDYLKIIRMKSLLYMSLKPRLKSRQIKKLRNWNQLFVLT